jgi:hypothetical protein
LAKEDGLTVRCDLNYRGKLWKYGKTPGEVMTGLMPHVDVAIGNEEDCEKVFGIKGADVKVAGEVSAERYLGVASELMRCFPNLRKVGITLRGSISATTTPGARFLREWWTGRDLNPRPSGFSLGRCEPDVLWPLLGNSGYTRLNYRPSRPVENLHAFKRLSETNRAA